jgi:hypothetical protein
MVDEELILRFFALHSGLQKYRPPLRRTLDQYMDANRRMEPARLAELSVDFESASQFMSTVFGPSSFRVVDRRNRPTERNINRALYDAQMLPIVWISDLDQATGLRSKIVNGAADLLGDDTFDDAIRLATSDRRRTMTRVKLWAEMLEEIGVEIDSPRFVRDFDPNE